MHADLQRLLADDLLSDVAATPMERLRSIRVQLNDAEADVSFVRRVSQGRLDIVGHEVRRRSGATSDGGTDDGNGGTDDGVSELLFDMPDILTDAAQSLGPGGGGRGRAVSILDPGPIALTMVETLDAIASPAQLTGIQSVAEGQLADLLDALREFEVELSSIRRSLHDRIDSIQDEIARRYRDGEASVDALLR